MKPILTFKIGPFAGDLNKLRQLTGEEKRTGVFLRHFLQLLKQFTGI